MEAATPDRTSQESSAPLDPGANVPAPHVPAPRVPAPDVAVSERWWTTFAAWTEWFGPARLVTSAIAVLVVCGGVFWLVRSSPPSTEAGLPMATTPSTTLVGASGDPASSNSPSSGAADGAAADLALAGTVSIHVAGAVERAGVYELDAGSRVHAAIAAAGGATADADPNALNLAAELVDGTRVYVPVVGEQLPVDNSVAVVAGSAAPPEGPVDVNRATAVELDVLPGVGPATAAAIVAERERNGPFLDVDELSRVRGIGPAKLEALAGLITT